LATGVRENGGAGGSTHSVRVHLKSRSIVEASELGLERSMAVAGTVLVAAISVSEPPFQSLSRHFSIYTTQNHTRPQANEWVSLVTRNTYFLLILRFFACPSLE